MRKIYLFYSNKSQLNKEIIRLIQVYDLQGINQIPYDKIVEMGKEDEVIPQEITTIPAIAIYENDILVKIVEGLDVLPFIKRIYNLDNIDTQKHEVKTQPPYKLGIPQINKQESIKINEQQQPTIDPKELHKNLSSGIGTEKIDNLLKKMIPKVKEIEVTGNQEPDKTEKSILRAINYAQFNPKNKRLISIKNTKLISDIKKEFPLDKKTGQPMTQDIVIQETKKNEK